MEESQSNPRRSRRIASQPSLTPEKPLRAKRTRLTRSKSPSVVRTSIPTTSEILVTPTISGNPAFTEEVLHVGIMAQVLSLMATYTDDGSHYG